LRITVRFRMSFFLQQGRMPGTDEKSRQSRQAMSYFGITKGPPRRDLLRRVLTGSPVSSLLSAFVGCTTIKIPSSGIPSTGSSTGLTGNWQFQVTPTTGPTPFTSLSGFIDELNEDPGVNDSATATLQAQSSTCFVDTTLIPLQGTVQGTQLSLYSFSIVNQFVSIAATEDSTATHMTGTYTIGGGCANGAAGTLAGTEYAPLTGGYAGGIAGDTPEKTLNLNLSQLTQGSGDGTFLVSGSATFSGFSCFTEGTLASMGSFVSGSSVNLTFNTDDVSDARLLLAGTIDPAADTLTLSSIRVTGGVCSGSAWGATLTRTP
jgi:hypothetical protein